MHIYRFGVFKVLLVLGFVQLVGLCSGSGGLW